MYLLLALACAAFLALTVWDYNRRDAEYRANKRTSHIIRSVMLLVAMLLNVATWIMELR